MGRQKEFCSSLSQILIHRRAERIFAQKLHHLSGKIPQTTCSYTMA